MAAFSLLIATVNRAEPLRRLLASLEEQSYHDFEILIADQNPPGFLDELYAEFQNTLPLRVITVPDKGVSQARNALLPHAQGQLVAFPDDDCWYEPETLEQVRAFFAANPHVYAVLGQWHDPAGSIRLQASGRAINRFSAFRRGGTLVQFYRKAVVDAVGGFDPELGPGTGLPYGCGEDTDYVLRALAAGFTVVFTPKRAGLPSRGFADLVLAGKNPLLRPWTHASFTQAQPAPLVQAGQYSVPLIACST